MEIESNSFAPPGTRRLCVMRDGHAVVRDWQIPKPTVLVDTREQQPYSCSYKHYIKIAFYRRYAVPQVALVHGECEEPDTCA